MIFPCNLPLSTEFPLTSIDTKLMFYDNFAMLTFDSIPTLQSCPKC